MTSGNLLLVDSQRWFDDYSSWRTSVRVANAGSAHWSTQEFRGCNRIFTTFWFVYFAR